MPLIIDDLTIETSVTLQGTAVGTPVSLTPDLANAQGSATALARADHVHNIPTAAAATQTPDQANAQGVAATFARADHIHAIATAAPAANLTATTTNAQGAATSFARSDHSHAITTGAPSTQNPDQANATGTSVNIARADHIHQIPTATAVSLTTATTNAQGASTSFARADHTHSIEVLNQSATATADYAVNGAAVITGMTLTPAAGTYFVSFSSSAELNASAEGFDYGIFAGGTLQTHSQRSVLATLSFGTPTFEYTLHSQAVVTVNGSQAITANIISETGTATIHQRSLILIRLN